MGEDKMTTSKIRVMLADDDAGLREALADTVRSAPDLELVGDAADAAGAIQLAEAARPDVVLMDVRMPGGGGVTATQELHQKHPEIQVVALSTHEDKASVLKMLEAGAVAYVVKGVPEPEIIDAIRRAHRGQMSLSAELGSSAFRDLLHEVRARRESEQLLARLIAVQEQERLRIASNIHDDTIQAMTAASLRMQQLRRHLTEEAQIELMTRLEEAVRESTTRLRRLMFDLRPAALDQAGLEAALWELLERTKKESNLQFTLESHLTTQPAGSAKTALYRIAQEALANVEKHAAATEVRVDLSEVSGGCRVSIVDNGRGFDHMKDVAGTEQLGLVSMRERAQIAGGWWKVHTPDAGGTAVEFWLPFSAQAAPVEPLAVGVTESQ
jgi:signal transduction histidine kinase